jgi:AbrB family looped-hinge helix DNA binding protein
MKTTIDSAGRLVVPKPLRDALGLRGGEQLDIAVRENGRLELAVPATPMRLEPRAHGVVAVADREMPTLTQDTVRETLERVRR